VIYVKLATHENIQHAEKVPPNWQKEGPCHLRHHAQGRQRGQKNCSAPSNFAFKNSTSATGTAHTLHLKRNDRLKKNNFKEIVFNHKTLVVFHNTDTHTYILSLAFALLIHNNK
jgi:hypothetical protein